MIYLLLITLATIGVTIYAYNTDYCSGGKEVGIMLAVLGWLYVIFSFILILIAQTTEFPGWKTEYDQVSKLIQDVNPISSEDLIGIVAELNSNLKKKQYYNSVTFCDPYISDRYMDVEPIEIPNHLKYETNR